MSDEKRPPVSPMGKILFTTAMAVLAWIFIIAPLTRNGDTLPGNCAEVQETVADLGQRLEQASAEIHRYRNILEVASQENSPEFRLFVEKQAIVNERVDTLKARDAEFSRQCREGTADVQELRRLVEEVHAALDAYDAQLYILLEFYGRHPRQ